MHKLHKNQETRVMKKFGLTDTIVIENNIRQGRTTDLGLQYWWYSFTCKISYRITGNIKYNQYIFKWMASSS